MTSSASLAAGVTRDAFGNSPTRRYREAVPYYTNRQDVCSVSTNQVMYDWYRTTVAPRLFIPYLDYNFPPNFFLSSLINQVRPIRSDKITADQSPYFGTGTVTTVQIIYYGGRHRYCSLGASKLVLK